MSDKPKDVKVFTDQDGNEAMYVDGTLQSAQGETTVYATDIAHAVGNQLIRFSHFSLTRPDGYGPWPNDASELEQYIDRV